MMSWFYDHLARLIYIDAQNWKPTDVSELRGYVDQQRRSHYLDGYVGEYIVPNSSIWARESMLYADIVTYEDGEPIWNAPEPIVRPWALGNPVPWHLCEALRDMGAFTRSGLDVVSSVWGATDFESVQNWRDAERLTLEMLRELDAAKLIASSAREEQLPVLYHSWQLPMYRIEFKRLDVPLDDLRAAQEAMLAAEAGY